MVMACDLFHRHGHKTQLHKDPGEVLDSGFFHGLGHGVGLEVHEPPSLSRSGDDLVPGDVITLEPGLYRAGYGGVRLEDILLVTDDGAEVITSYPYDLEP
jgi:Xaa-Pro aminopeptidase